MFSRLCYFCFDFSLFSLFIKLKGVVASSLFYYIIFEILTLNVYFRSRVFLFYPTEDAKVFFSPFIKEDEDAVCSSKGETLSFPELAIPVVAIELEVYLKSFFFIFVLSSFL